MKTVGELEETIQRKEAVGFRPCQEGSIAPPGVMWDALNGLQYEIFSVTGEGRFARNVFTEHSDVVNWLATQL
jgi:hypothetical protein